MACLTLGRRPGIVGTPRRKTCKYQNHPKGKAMLVDFDISKIYDPKLRTAVGAKAITPGYSPPEQYGQGSTDAHSDL